MNSLDGRNIKFKSLSRAVQVRLAPNIDSLGDDPRPRGVKKLQGEDELYRIRVGDYRVIYQVRDKALIILVIKIADREEVYRRTGK